ncbi:MULTISPECIES: hypothetical protein [Lysinibacillus]|uniref:Uncharacterized protein n=2 Tax=Lysinibacillus TaxID=400634 RepID=A0ABY8KP37_9BACI|nr:hypothetical protein [Lysinibacillus capsici]WGF39919.1 hypothetical protein QBO96_06535 [Lysinibacillus capsici]
MTQTAHALKPIVEMLNRQKAFIEQLDNINPNFQKWHLSIEHLVNSQSENLDEPLPESVYPSLNDITLEFENASYLNEEVLDVPIEVTERELSMMQDKKMTWADLTILIITIWSAIYFIYSDYASALQREEQISELKLQNELTKKQIEIDEKKLINTEQLLELEQERHEQQQRFEEKFNTFIESLEPYLTDRSPSDND